MSAAGNPHEPRPKVFLSYSWTTPQHQDQIRQWAERLLSDGVDVVMDLFDLKEGHDKYRFMERMVTDSTITHVLVLSDKRYAERADRSEAGVGAESQIISSEVYEKVEQSKFVPIICELSETGAPYVPVFMKSRIFIDFSSTEAVNRNWEQLVRLLFGKPIYKKPQIGAPPSYLLQEAGVPATPLQGKLAILKQAIVASSRTVAPCREDFLEACLSYISEYRVTKDPQLSQQALAERFIKDLSELKIARDSIVDWVLHESSIQPEDNFRDALFDLLEKLLATKSRPETMNTWHEYWFDGLRVFVYEVFLYIVAALLKTKCFDLLGELLAASFLRPTTDAYSGRERFGTVAQFAGGSELLGKALNPPGSRLFSPAAELISRQANRQDIPLTAVIQADLLVFLKSIATQEFRWYPQTLSYAKGGTLELFVRAAQHRHFRNLAKVIGVQSADELKEKTKTGYEASEVQQSEAFWMSFTSPWNYLNIDQYDTK